MFRKKLASLPKLTLLSIVLIFILGVLFSLTPRTIVEGHNRDFSGFAKTPSYQKPPQSILSVEQQKLKNAFDRATLLMQNKHYAQSLPFWHQVLNIDSQLPEAHVNLGFVMFELNRYEASEKSFLMALELRAQQANAYWGLALLYERQNKLPEAIGAMRTFIHLSADKTFTTRARAALWEWQAELAKTLEAVVSNDNK